jgi:hypothetical protein
MDWKTPLYAVDHLGESTPSPGYYGILPAMNILIAG